MQLPRCLAVTFIVVTTFGSAPFARADVVIKINKETQRLSVVVDGAELYQWPASTARPGYTTPNGIYRPVRLERHWFSKKYDDAPMPYSIFFHGGYAIHGSYETSKIGKPASHGCVRLHPANAETLFKIVKDEGIDKTRVVIEGPAASARQARTELAHSSHAPLPHRDGQLRRRSRDVMLAYESRVPRHAEPARESAVSPRSRQFVGPFEELFSYISNHSR